MSGEPAITEPPPIPDVKVRTQREVAEFFGVKPREVQRWKANGCPGLVTAPYDIGEVRKWRDQRAETQVMGRPIGAKPSASLTESKERKAAADADKAELDAKLKHRQLEILEHDWVSRKTVDELFLERQAAVRAALILMPPSGARETIASSRLGEHEAIWQRHVDDALELLSSERFYELLKQRERRLKSGASLTRGRGRPKGSKNKPK